MNPAGAIDLRSSRHRLVAMAKTAQRGDGAARSDSTARARRRAAGPDDDVHLEPNPPRRNPWLAGGAAVLLVLWLIALVLLAIFG